jgi:succinylglutamate desuccinylase
VRPSTHSTPDMHISAGYHGHEACGYALLNTLLFLFLSLSISRFGYAAPRR